MVQAGPDKTKVRFNSEKKINNKKSFMPGAVVHSRNPSTWEAETGG
jgi:hypothetical protein